MRQSWPLLKSDERYEALTDFDPYCHVTGKVVDQDALVEALQAQKIRAAALDVTYPEPLPRSEGFKLSFSLKTVTDLPLFLFLSFFL